jgi:hypothetical protein
MKTCKECGQKLPTKQSRRPKKFDRVYGSEDNKIWYIGGYEFLGKAGGTPPQPYICNLVCDKDLSATFKHVRKVDDPRPGNWRAFSTSHEGVEASYYNLPLYVVVDMFRRDYGQPFFHFNVEKLPAKVPTH